MTPRPLELADVPAAVEVFLEALPADPDHSGERPAWLEARTRHLLATDPAGCWAAEHDGELAGVACALERDGVWGLSVLAVRPRLHARGIGRALLDAALTYRPWARGGLVVSSTDPKAMRLYALAGFRLLPCVGAAGRLDRAALPAGLRSRPGDDVEAAAALSRAVRGGAYAPTDLAMVAARPGSTMLELPGRGFALRRDGSPALLCARDDEAATDLLWSCLASAPPGATVHVDFMTAGQDWAVQTCLAAGLALSPDGPVFARGDLGPLRPWLPSGALL